MHSPAQVSGVTTDQEAAYHRAGLRYAVIYDFSVAWKLALSLAVLVVALFARDWIDSLFILVVMARVLGSEVEEMLRAVLTRTIGCSGSFPG